MHKVQKTYTPECKREAVRLAQTSGKPIAQVARELGISDTSLHQWRKVYPRNDLHLMMTKRGLSRQRDDSEADSHCDDGTNHRCCRARSNLHSSLAHGMRNEIAAREQ